MFDVSNLKMKPAALHLAVIAALNLNTSAQHTPAMNTNEPGLATFGRRLLLVHGSRLRAACPASNPVTSGFAGGHTVNTDLRTGMHRHHRPRESRKLIL